MRLNYEAAGFTIIEVMITIAIAGVMAALALPSYNNLVKNNCMTTSANSLVTSLQLAKSEAVKRRNEITLEPIKSSGDSDYAANEWGEGWTVLDDTVSPSETLRVVELTCGLETMTIDGDDTSVTYDASGFTNTTSTFTICDDRTNETGREISVNSLGRPSTDSEHNCT